MTDEELGAAIRAAIRASPSDARPLVTQLARRASARGDGALGAEAAFWRAEVEFAAGHVAAAARAYDAAWEHFRRDQSSPLRAAALLGRLQTHAQMGRTSGFRSMARTLRRAVATPRQAAAVECAIGTSYNALGDDARAEECFRNALGLLARQRNAAATVLRAKARHNLAIRLGRRGRTDAALRELDAAAAELAKQGESTWLDRINHNRGWLLGLLGRVPEALDAFDQARTRFEADGNTRSAGIVLRDEAALLLRIGAPRKAAERATAAARLLPRLEAARARLLAARALRQDRPARARTLARNARTVLADAGDAAGAAIADTLLGEATARTALTLQRRGHWLSALEALLASNPSVARLRRAIAAYPASIRRWLAPEIERRLARGPDRIPRLRRAFRAAEELRLLAPTTVLRAQALLTHRAAYKEFVTALLDRGRPQDRREAFSVVDALQARTLREQLDREAPGLGEADPDVATLQRRLELAWRQLEHDEESGSDLRRARGASYRELHAIEEELREALGAVPGRRVPSRATLPDFTVLSFAVLGKRVVALRANESSVDVIAEASLSQVRELVAAFSFQVQRRLHGDVSERIALDQLDRLGHLLLGSRGWSGPVGIVVPPELGDVPIEILPPLQDAEPFHLPWAGMQSRRRRAAGQPLVVGFGSTQLPEVAREVRDVKRQLRGADVLCGPGATRAKVLTSLASRPLIHLAGHAAVDDQLPLMSALRTADGWLTAMDFTVRPLRGSVVVLSACRTGDPALRWEGEALAGFPRALLAGGAAAVVASRWEVRDKAARAWMSHFYRFLVDGNLPRALRGSTLEMRKAFPHPADWGAFLLISHGRPRSC